MIRGVGSEKLFRVLPGRPMHWSAQSLLDKLDGVEKDKPNGVKEDKPN